MAINPDFKQAAYNINCVLNGLDAEWCDRGGEPDANDFRRNLEDLRANLLPHFAAANESQAAALRDALHVLDMGKPGATAIVRDVLQRIGNEVAEIAEHRVDFGKYCSALSENKARAYAGKPMRDPNLRVV